MTPEEHYRAGEQLLGQAQTMDPSLPVVTGGVAETLRLAHAEFRAAEVGVMLGRPSGGKVEQQFPISEELAGERTALYGITVADQLNAQRHAPPNIDVVPDGDSLTGFRTVSNRPDTAARLAEQAAMLLKINGELERLTTISDVNQACMSQDSLNAARERAYGRGIAMAVQRVREIMDEGA